jgi:hypothetical protein
MNEDVEFVEDRTYLTALPETKIPEKSLEGWFYRHVPGSIGLKKFLLLCIIILLFGASIILFLMSRETSVDRVRPVGFNSSPHETL